MSESKALAVRAEVMPPAFQPANLVEAFDLAKELSQASIIPSHLRRQPADVYATLLLGRDLGLSPMQAVLGIHVIEGRPSVSAQTAVALVKRSPLCDYFRCVETSATKAVYETHRKGDPEPQRMPYTIEDAQRAGLAGRSTWKAHPAAMLRARASMALARDVYPDVVGNLYDPDELDEAVERAENRAAELKAPPPPPKAAPPPASRAPSKAPGRSERSQKILEEEAARSPASPDAGQPMPAEVPGAPAPSQSGAAADELVGALPGVGRAEMAGVVKAALALDLIPDELAAVLDRVAGRIRELLDEATTHAEIDALREPIKALPAALHAALKASYTERWKALKA